MVSISCLTSKGDLVYSTGTRNLHRCGAVTWDSVQECYKTTPTFVCYVSGFAGAFSNLSNTPTTLSGYGITDAKIESGTITLGSDTITPITSHQSLAGYWNNTNSGTSSYDWAAKDMQVEGDLTLGTNGNSIKMKSAGNALWKVLYLSSANNLQVGYDVATNGGKTYIQGTQVQLRYGTSPTAGVILNSSGNVTIGSTDLASTTNKLYVSGNVAATGTITTGGNAVWHAGNLKISSVEPTSADGNDGDIWIII